MRLVVGYDGSEAGKRALEPAATMATDGDDVIVVAAAESHARTGITEDAHLDPSEVQRRRQDLVEATAFLKQQGVEARTIESQGDPGAVIIDAAENADLVIVGSRASIHFSECCSARSARRSSIEHSATSLSFGKPPAGPSEVLQRSGRVGLLRFT